MKLDSGSRDLLKQPLNLDPLGKSRDKDRRHVGRDRVDDVAGGAGFDKASDRRRDATQKAKRAGARPLANVGVARALYAANLDPHQTTITVGRQTWQGGSKGAAGMVFCGPNAMSTSPSHPKAVFILVRPQYSGNLGSVARVLRNFGQKELRLVAPAARWTEEARRMAVGADALVEQAGRFATLQEAVTDLAWTAATASMRARGRKGSASLRQVVRDAARKAKVNRIGFVFGPEDSGLTDGEIALCRSLAHIPAEGSHPTLNLAQAVALVAYELFLAGLPAAPPRTLASSRSMEGLFAHLQEMLVEVGFLNKNNPERMIKVMRRILSRAELSEEEVVVLRGVCRQVLWGIENKN